MWAPLHFGRWSLGCAPAQKRSTRESLVGGGLDVQLPPIFWQPAFVARVMMQLQPIFR